MEGIGVDIELNERFSNLDPEKDKDLLSKIFTDKELDYCFSKTQPEQGLTARFCGKEAAIKALASMQISDVKPKDIEILNNHKSVPVITIQKYPDYKMKISLSHTKDMSIAFVVIEGE